MSFPFTSTCPTPFFTSMCTDSNFSAFTSSPPTLLSHHNSLYPNNLWL
nr:MAG TPA: hypothetical protein [Caudoviricetes sp.]